MVWIPKIKEKQGDSVKMLPRPPAESAPVDARIVADGPQRQSSGHKRAAKLRLDRGSAKHKAQPAIKAWLNHFKPF